MLIPEPMTQVGFPELVLGMHLVIVVALAPSLASAIDAGDLPQAGSLVLLMTLIAVLGVMMRRIALRRAS